MLVFLCIVSLLSLTLDAEQDFTMPDQEEELSQKSCDMGWYSFSGRCYKYVASQLDWADAESYCGFREQTWPQCIVRMNTSLSRSWSNHFDLTGGQSLLESMNLRVVTFLQPYLSAVYQKSGTVAS
uniref:C-type lectin domain-containing protein n=1 Tax=Salmo trutta TaxID=8032 RepID=A0A673Z8U1_SALTR